MFLLEVILCFFAVDARRRRIERDGHPNPLPYYIGNIIIQTGKGTVSPDLIIDGQQRITTTFLILKALELKGLNKKNKEKLEEVLFFNKKKEMLRVGFTRENLNTAFNFIVVQDDLSEENFPDENSKRFLKNFNFIKKELNKVEDVDEFFEKVINAVFVVIKFDEGYNVNQLFEGLNSKGKILSTVQLTKNALLGSIKKDDTSRNIIINIWELMERDFEETKKIVWFDKFLRHYGFLKYGYISNKNLFKEIKKDLLKNKENILDFSNQLKNDSDLYLKIRTANILKKDIAKGVALKEWGPIERIILNLSKADLDQVYSVLLALIKHAKTNFDYVKPKGTSESKFLHDLKRVWAFSILAKYLDIKPSLYERLYAALSHSGFKEKDRKVFFDRLVEILYGQNKEKFIVNINNRIKITGEEDKKINSCNDRNFVSQLLAVYLEDGKRFVVEDLTIEHIIPKGKKDGLKEWKNISKKYIKQVENYDRYKFGNLTLLRSDKAENKSFNGKIKVYLKDVYKNKHRLLEKYRVLFNSENPGDAVCQRGKEMAASLFDILLDILEK